MEAANLTKTQQSWKQWALIPVLRFVRIVATHNWTSNFGVIIICVRAERVNQMSEEPKTPNAPTIAIDCIRSRHGQTGVNAVSDFLSTLPHDATINWGDGHWVPAHIFANEIIIND